MRTFACLIAILFTVSAASAQNEWREFKSEADGFSVEMPGAPKVTDKDMGQGQSQKFFTVDIGSEDYTASVIHLKAGRVPANPDKGYFDILVKAYVDGSKTTLRSSRLFTWAGRPAVEAITDFEGTTHTVDVMTAGDNIYLVVYAGPKANASTKKATHLRDSFKLLSK